MDVKMDKGDLVTAGYSKDLAVVTGCGDTPEAAAKQAYKHIKAVSFEEMEYRPELDYLSRDYFSSILNRYDYALKNKLI